MLARKTLGVWELSESVEIPAQETKGLHSPRARAHPKGSNDSHSMSPSARRAPPGLKIPKSSKGVRASGAKEASIQLDLANTLEKQDKHPGLSPSKVLPRLTPRGAQQSTRNLVTRWSATNTDWSAEKLSRGTAKTTSIPASPSITQTPSGSQKSTRIEAGEREMGPMTALRQLKAEVMHNIHVSLANTVHVSLAATPRTFQPSENFRQPRQSPRANPKGSWVPRVDVLRERTQHGNRQTKKEFEHTEEFLARWSTAHPTTRGSVLSIEGDAGTFVFMNVSGARVCF